MVTLRGERMAQRVAASMLQAIGMNELITESADEYEELAVSLAQDMNRLWDLRNQLQERRDTMPLFDTQRWVRNFEQGLSQVWDVHERGEVPRSLSIQDTSASES